MNPIHSEIDQALSAKGIVILHDDSAAQQLLEMLKNCTTGPDFFERYGLRTVFLYDQADQPEEFRKFDGMCFEHRNEDTGDSLYSIGISTSALKKGQDYVNRLWLHETAHLLHGADVTAHDERFSELLTVLLDEFEEAEKTARNGLESRENSEA